MVIVYTDGAASNNGYDNAVGGYGWVVQIRNERPIIFGGSKQGATNNQMELTAMISALSFIEGCYSSGDIQGEEEIFVYTDSAYIFNCCSQKWYVNWEKNGWINSKKEPVANKELWKTLIPWFKRPNIHIVKVKGHSTTLGNQIADKIAVAARTMSVEEFAKFRTELTNKLERI